MIKAFNARGERHNCQDETATAVNGRLTCQCPGGPYFTKQPEIPHTLISHWEQYRELNLSEISQPEALVELRRAYFAGAHCLIYELDRAGQMEDDERAAHLVALNHEIEAFANLAKEGLDRATPEGLVLDGDEDRIFIG